MPKGKNQKLKLLYLIRIFTENSDELHPLKTPAIIDLLGKYGVDAERKSIYEDIEALRSAGYDIIKTFSGFYLGERHFEAYELKLLADAVQSSKFITKKKSEVLIKKLSSFLSRYDAVKLSRQIYLSSRVKAVNEEIYYNVDALQSAMQSNSSVTFTYFDWNERKEKILRHGGAPYRVSPWALTWDDENYYLVAYDEAADKLKHFRVDKMLRINETGEARRGGDIAKSLDMAQYAVKTFGMFGGEETAVTLECDNSLAGVIIDRFGTDPVFISKGESFLFTARVAVSPVFFSWVAGFGGRMRIVSPEGVRRKFKDLLIEALDGYGEIGE